MLMINKLSVAYRERVALNNITLSQEAGEVLALIGPNGAGKSTLIRAVSGLLPLRSGSITLNGKPITAYRDSERARLLAVVPQAHNLPANFSVYQTVMLGRTPYLGWLGNAGRQDRLAVEKALAQVGISEMADRLNGELSGGEQQRVLLARALAQETPILLLDEPTNHLDLRHQTSFLNLVRQLAVDNRLAVMVALHDLNLAALYADRVAILADGTLRALGSPAQVFYEEVLTPIYGSGVRVFTHPETGTPLVLPGGPGEAYAPQSAGFLFTAAYHQQAVTHV